jgi:RNA polymerase sigma-70 factor, ECF subfamily
MTADSQDDAGQDEISGIPAFRCSDTSLSPALYDQLTRLARSFMARERQGHTLQAGDLVHLAYLRLQEQGQHFPGGKTQFMALAATMMRRILVNHALGHQAQKRGDGQICLTLSAAELVAHPSADNALDVLELDRVLKKLDQVDPRMVSIVELRYFSGLSIEDTAEALAISPATVKREWNLAKRWLARELS